MIKAEIRKAYKSKRLNLSVKDVNSFQDLLLIRFQEMLLPYVQIAHSYVPMFSSNEPDPAPLLDYMQFRDLGMKIAYPRINASDFSMKHFLVDKQTVFLDNQYGIPEPTAGIEVTSDMIDVVFVPLLAFDKKGNRVGYGKGYYDRFLASCRNDVITIGLSFFPPVLSIDDIDFFDKKLDFCITPECVYAF